MPFGRLLAALALLLATTVAAAAQIPCTPQLANSVACFSGAVNLQSTDLLSGMQAAGPLRSPQSVSVTPGQILNGLPIGSITPNTGKFTTLVSTGTASFGGVVSLGNSNANFATVTGGSAIATIQTAGSGTNAQLSLRGLGSGTGGGVNLGSTAGGNAFSVIGSSATGHGSLQFTQPAASTSPFVFSLLANTGGITFLNTPVQFQRSYSYSGVNSMANRGLGIVNTIGGISADTGEFALNQIQTTLTNFTATHSAAALDIQANIGSGTLISSPTALFSNLQQSAQPTSWNPAVTTSLQWQPTTSYSVLGTPIVNGTNAYELTTVGTSASSGGPTGTSGSNIVDGTARWMALGPLAIQGGYIGSYIQNTLAFNLGGTSNNAPIGNGWGAVIGVSMFCPGGDGDPNCAEYYGEAVGLEVDSNVVGPASADRVAVLQLVKFGDEGKRVDWGISLAGGPSRNGIIFQTAIDPNGYGIAFTDQVVGGLQTMAGAIDLSQVNANGSGPTGGGFLVRWANGQIGNTGNITTGCIKMAVTASGMTVDCAEFYISGSPSAPSGGTLWQANEYATDTHGGLYQVTTVAAGVPTAMNTIVKGHATTAITSDTFSAQTGGPLGTTGNPAISTPFTATVSYTLPATPDYAIGATNLKTIEVGNSSSTLTLNGTIKAGASTGVSCPSGVTAGTVVVVNGIVTHC